MAFPWMSNRQDRLDRLAERTRLVETQASALHWDADLGLADYFVIDIETSGFDAVHDLVLSLAAAHMSAPTLAMDLQQYDLVCHNEVHQVPEHIWHLTGLSPQMLQGGQPWPQVLRRALALSAQRVWIAHHARHELAFLQRHARLLWRVNLRPLVIDTAVVAQALLSLARVPTLEEVCNHLDVPIANRHRADEDVRMTAAVWRREMELCKAMGLATVGAVIDWSMSHAP